MTKVIEEVSNVPNLYFVWCPGCKEDHVIWDHSCDRYPNGWDFNGDYENPTFKPSILVQSTWGNKHEKRRCHSYIENGNIRFLNDCTHDLKGQTVKLELEPIDD